MAAYKDHKPLDLVLMWVWFDKIERGEKKVENRVMSVANTDRVFAWLRRGPPYIIRLRRGYTKTALFFEVKRVVVDVTAEKFRICLGARLNR